jgi:hypothetical protein
VLTRPSRPPAPRLRARPSRRPQSFDAPLEPSAGAPPAHLSAFGGSKRAAIRQRIRRLRKWATTSVTALAFFLATSGPASARGKQVVEEPKPYFELNFEARPDRAERSVTAAEKAASFAIALGAASGLVYWNHVQGKKENVEEEERIKSETERLKKMQEEFLMDDKVTPDEDLLESLRKRMTKAGSDEGEPDSSPGDSLDGFEPPEPSDPPPDPPAPSAGGPSSATMPPPPPPPPLAKGPAGDAPKPPAPAEGGSEDAAARDADIERLRRMFGNPAE